MAHKRENVWLDNLGRQAGMRRAIVIHGDVHDVRFSEESGDYQPVVDVALQQLRRAGFDHVIRWDRSTGIDERSKATWSTLAREATPPSNSRAAPGAAYDMGTQATSTGNVANDGGPPLAADDFLAVAHYHMLHPAKSRYAFVVDWSQYLFGNANAPSEHERIWLLMLAKAIQNAPLPLDSADSIRRPTNLIVLICGRIGVLPPSLYQGNGSVCEVVVPTPGRVEREWFLSRTIDKWNLRAVPRPGELAFTDFVDALEGLSLRDGQQLIKLSRQSSGDPLTFEGLINLYRYGEQKSPWEDLSRAKLATIRDNLARRVKGQDQAIGKVASVIIRAYTGLSGLQHSKKQKMPKGTLFFVGPTGVGKTELAKALAQFLFGDEESCVRFDMSEFNHEHSDQRLIGAPPGYVGFEEGGQLTNAVRKRPFSVLLFDEIEKAHPRILDKFLQILEDGRLTDGKGETVSFSETVIIFTSNIGAAEVQVSEDTEYVKRQFLEKVKEHFLRASRPELLNRIGDNIVPFNFITSGSFLVAIAKAKLLPLRERLKEKYRIADLHFDDEEKALKSITESVDPAMGGRGVLNEIVTRLIDPLAEFLFEEEDDSSLYAGRTVVVHQAGSTPAFVFELR